MDAIVLDIDGTLVESFDIDADLYMEAVRDVLGPVTFRDQWGDYENVTDGGILDDLLLDNHIARSSSIVQNVQTVFFEKLSNHIETHGPFVEIPGARGFVESIISTNDVVVAYATGGWRVSAKLKLQSAGFPISTVPLATSDDSNKRAEIMQIALQQLGEKFHKITYYGDGQWDRVAAAKLDWDFEPVGNKLDGIKKYGVYSV